MKISVQIEMVVKRSDCFVFKLPEGITKEAFEEIVNSAEEYCEYSDEWVNKVRQDVFELVGKYPDMVFRSQGVNDGELEILQLESGDIFCDTNKSSGNNQ